MKLQGREQEIARDVVAEINSRLAFLEDVGLGYLSLSRSAPTLSGGEAQRIRLAAQLGSNLQGVCYILDEPTIGLHPRDNGMLLDTLDRLAAKGNSLLVVEHDEDTIRRADYVVDLGPGAGSRGGEVVAAGTAAELQRRKDSVTGRCCRIRCDTRCAAARCQCAHACATDQGHLAAQSAQAELCACRWAGWW